MDALLNFENYVSLSNEIADMIMEKYPSWIVTNNTHDWNCQISIAAYPEPLKLSIASIPLTGNLKYEIMVLQSSSLRSVYENINIPEEEELIRFETPYDVIEYLDTFTTITYNDNQTINQYNDNANNGSMDNGSMDNGSDGSMDNDEYYELPER